MQKVVLYTVHCGKCMVLEKKLTLKNIQFDIVENEDEIIKAGVKEIPSISVDGVLYDFHDANEWIKNYGGSN